MKSTKFTIALTLGILLLNSLKAQQWNGLTYYSNTGSTSGYLMDTNSVNVVTYTFNSGTGYSTHFMPGGNFVRSVSNPGNILTGGGMTGRLQKLDYAGNVLWDWTYSSSTYCLHHDHCVLPNGNILVISYDVKNATEIAAAGCTSTITSMWSEKIMEIQPVGTNSANIVWQWNVWDHLVQNADNSKNNYQTSIVNHPELLHVNYKAKKDWLHMNGVDYNPVLDQIALSTHNLNEWYIIDHSTTTAQAATHTDGNAGKGGDILYRWGNPLAYQAVGSPSILNVTHDSHWIPEGVPGAGNLAGVNNNGVTGPNKTTIDAVQVPRLDYNYTITPGSAFTPSTFTTRHISTGNTSNMGSSNQFPNGNQMICLAMLGTIYEIDPAGNTLWTKSTGGACSQSHRYTTCFLNNPAPPQPTISLNGLDLVSTSATTYQWYLNGNLIVGATNQTFTPSQNGIYVVRTTDVNGCVNVYSAGHQFGTPSKINSTSNELNTFEIYPNPANDFLNLRVNSENYFVKIYSVNGQILFSQNNVTNIDLSHFSNGMYFINVSDERGSVSKKFVLLK